MPEQDSRKKVRILLITRNFPPLLGGMEKFNARLFAEMARECDVAICGPAGCAQHAPANALVSEVRGRNLVFFLPALAASALKMARRFRPDVVVAGSGLTGPIALMAARASQARCAIFLYGLDLVVKSRIYQWVWMPAIRAADQFFPISKYTQRLAEERGLASDRMQRVTPGVDIPVIDARAADEFRDRFALQGRPIILTVGRLTNRKGIAEFVQKALPDIVRKFPDVALVVIGGEASDALAGNRSGAMDRIRQASEAAGVARNTVLLGRCADEVVLAACQASQVHAFPVIEIPGDVEGFGMVALEAAANGLPTVAFRVGGIPDAVEDGVSGTLVAPGDYAGMAAAIGRYLERAGPDSSIRESCIDFAHRFEWSAIGRRLVDVLRYPSVTSRAADA